MLSEKSPSVNTDKKSAEKTREFLSRILPGGRWAHFWTPNGPWETDKNGDPYQARISSWFPTEHIPDVPASWAEKNVFFSVNTSNKKRGERQKMHNADVVALAHVYAEFDAKDFSPYFSAQMAEGRKKDDLTPDEWRIVLNEGKPAILAHLDNFPHVQGWPYPSVIIDSGGGYQCYWLFEETLFVHTDEERQHAADMQEGWVKLIGGDATVHDLARVLRVPGTKNFKPQYGPNFPTVTVVEADFRRLYQRGEFEYLTADIRAEIDAKQNQNHQNSSSPQSPHSPQFSTKDDEQLIHKAMNARANGAQFAKLWAGQHDGDHSSGDQALCNLLAYWTGKDPAQMDRLFRQSGLYREKWEREDYRRMTIERAINGVRNVYDPNFLSVDNRDAIAAAAAAVGMNGAHTNGDGPKMSTGTADGGNAPTNEPSGPGGNGRLPADKVYLALGFTPHETDLGNAERLVTRYGANLRYVYAWGKWLVWDGTRWVMDETGEIERYAKDTVTSIYEEASQEPDDAKRKSIAKWAFRSESQQRIGAMIALARSEPGIAVPHIALDADNMLLNVNNGTLNLRTGTLEPHNPAHLITKRVNVDYDPAAQCPRWLTFLDRILAGDQELISFVQKAVGYSLTGDVSEQALFFMHGNGKNGKSTFTETLITLLGDYAQKAPTEMLMLKHGGNSGVPNDVARLPGARFVVAAEVEEGRRLAESMVKDLTGGDTMSARFMRAEWFDFQPTHKIWMYGNHEPVIHGTDDGIWRRMRKIPFTVQIPETEQDPQLKTKLLAELPGILAWAVEGVQLWQNEGLGLPKAVKDATAGYRSQMDVIGAFLDAECEINPLRHVVFKDLYAAYNLWCVDNGERSLSGRRFGSELTHRGFAADKGTGNSSTRRGLCLRTSKATP